MNSGKTFPTLDPRTAEVIAHVAEAESEDVDRAVAAARKAFDEGPWPKMTAYVSTVQTANHFCPLVVMLLIAIADFFSLVFHLAPIVCVAKHIILPVYLFLQERSRIMLRVADLVEKNTDELAALETWDNGKTYEQAIGEVEVLARLFRYYAGAD